MFFLKNFEGLILQDKYLFNKQIGRGNQGAIYLATVLNQKPVIQGEEQAQVAIKVVQHQALKAKEKELLQNEIQALKEIDSNYVVKCIECLNDQENTYIVLEYCQYGSLEEYLRKNSFKFISERFLKDYFKQILFGLQELHSKRILHRDIKLSNILVKNAKEFKIADLGFCKKLAEDQNICQTVLGTKMYMAPELLKMEKYGIEAELFSVGVLFYLLSQGRFPFEANSPPQLLKAIENQQLKFDDISNELQDLLRKMLKYEPKERIQFKDIFNQPFFQEEDDVLFMNSSHCESEDIKLKVENHIKVYTQIENQIKPIPLDEESEVAEQIKQVNKPNEQPREFGLVPLSFQPPEINNIQNPMNQQPNNNQFRAFSNQGNPLQDDQNKQVQNQNKNLYPQLNNVNSQSQQQNQANNFFNLNQQPNNFVPFQRLSLQQQLNNPVNQNNQSDATQQQQNQQQQQQFQNQYRTGNNNNNNNLAPNQIPNIAGQNQIQNINNNQINMMNQMPQQNDILKKSSQYQFQQGNQINELQQKNKQICDALMKKAEDIQENYLYLFLAMRNLAYLSGKCLEFKVPFQSYIGASLFILKQKCFNMNKNLQTLVESQEYQPLRELNPQQYRKLVKNIENNKQEIDVFDFIADDEYSQVKNCIYPIFQEFIKDYVKNINRMFDTAYNNDLRAVLIDMLLDVLTPAKVTSNHTELNYNQKDELNKLIRNCCIYLIISIHVDDANVNIQELEQQLRRDNNNYKQQICDQLKRLIEQVDDSLLIKDIQSQQDDQQSRYDQYLKEQYEKYNDEVDDYEDFDQNDDEITFPLKKQFQRRLEEAKKQINKQGLN
ncbi:Serine/Threonine kinase domain protein (macronuclear) [Tetrahymena thermophila SB210]|uniref:Serine/Threonine kinase domain protein n=1 Tax=Tetrahymena thermophila (strain SB210) TaxID=312017 RepID=I7M1T4_TETTS|nr:Serine/Threonine kinase domain protein [Tetrahymena thermophila SB210]EAR97539.2 Serine/Threonine kinase domain protein [Tetrahymena thermophila SB210]|eukprot:XP_001017784.2 Serine/Threonine kinase domain protein [Tetrahymena thermophila SB210]